MIVFHEVLFKSELDAIRELKKTILGEETFKRKKKRKVNPYSTILYVVF